MKLTLLSKKKINLKNFRKPASASNVCLKDKNEMVFTIQKIDPFSKASFLIFHKTWYLNYLLHQMSLLKLKSHPTEILSLRI